MYVIPYPATRIRWGHREPIAHVLPPHRRPTQHPRRPVRGITRIVAPYVVSLAVSMITSLSWAATR